MLSSQLQCCSDVRSFLQFKRSSESIVTNTQNHSGWAKKSCCSMLLSVVELCRYNVWHILLKFFNVVRPKKFGQSAEISFGCGGSRRWQKLSWESFVLFGGVGWERFSKSCQPWEIFQSWRLKRSWQHPTEMHVAFLAEKLKRQSVELNHGPACTRLVSWSLLKCLVPAIQTVFVFDCFC